MPRKKIVANPSRCVIRQLCRTKVRALFGSLGSGLFSSLVALLHIKARKVFTDTIQGR